MAHQSPICGWLGGKGRWAEAIVAALPGHGFFLDAFGGGGSVIGAKPRIAPGRDADGNRVGETYNDLDGRAVNFFRILRDRPDELVRAVRYTPWARADFERCMAEPRADCPVEWARRTLVCFTGSMSPGGAGYWLTDTQRARDWRNAPRKLEAFAERFRGVVIENRPAISVIGQCDGPTTLHYCDPPYPAEVRASARVYAHEMTDADHAELADCLNSVEGMVVLSGYPCALYDRLYPDFKRVELPNKNHRGKSNMRPQPETLWLNSAAANGCEQKELGL